MGRTHARYQLISGSDWRGATDLRSDSDDKNRLGLAWGKLLNLVVLPAWLTAGLASSGCQQVCVGLVLVNRPPGVIKQRLVLYVHV